MAGPRPAADGGPHSNDLYDPPPAYRPRAFDPPPAYRPLRQRTPAQDRTRWIGGISTIIGLVTLSLAFAGGAGAAQQAAVSSVSCASGGWTDTVTISNSPLASNGVATISGTGTALDGTQLPAGGGHQSLVLSEPLSVKAVTVAGSLSWPKGFHAPFSTTALKPSSCGPVTKPAAPVQHAAVNNATPNVPEPKYYVCKYVGTPGQNERLQTGNNPIDVNGNAIGENPVVVGSFFNDAQGRSFVLAEDTGQTPPTIDACPEPTSTVTATATTTAPGPTVTVTGPTQTVTVTQGVTATVTEPGPTTTITGDPVTVQVPGPTVTVTVTPAATTSDTSTSDAKKVYVCKYVGTPGVDERLQTGQNPIDVSVNAIAEDPVVVGSFFNDAQGRSFVLAFDTGQTPPTAADCPAVGVPPTQTTTVTAPGTTQTTTVTAPGTTATVTAPGTTSTVTVTQTVPGCDPAGVAAVACPTATVTETVVAPGSTVTVVGPGSTQTVVGPGSTETDTVTAPGQTVTVTQTNDVIQNVISCPPGAQVAGSNAGSGVLGGSLAFTGAGNSSMMSLLGGALTAAGLTLLFMARKRWSPRRH